VILALGNPQGNGADKHYQPTSPLRCESVVGFVEKPALPSRGGASLLMAVYELTAGPANSCPVKRRSGARRSIGDKSAYTSHGSGREERPSSRTAVAAVHHALIQLRCRRVAPVALLERRRRHTHTVQRLWGGGGRSRLQSRQMRVQMRVCRVHVARRLQQRRCGVVGKEWSASAAALRGRSSPDVLV
jgi:hypothetical protein